MEIVTEKTVQVNGFMVMVKTFASSPLKYGVIFGFLFYFFLKENGVVI